MTKEYREGTWQSGGSRGQRVREQLLREQRLCDQLIVVLATKREYTHVAITQPITYELPSAAKPGLSVHARRESFP
jgi:hypothetical protein